MQIGVILQADFGCGADASLLVALLTDPEGKRRTPVARARDRPIDVVLEPVTHAAGLDVRRHPVGGGVVGDELGLAVCRADVPGVERVVDQRRLASPALGVGVEDGAGLVEQTSRLEVVLDERVCLFDMKSGELVYVRKETTVEADRVLERDALFLTQSQVVDTVKSGRVDNAGAFFCRYEVRVDDVVRPTFGRNRIEVQRLVVESDEVLALHSLDDLVIAFEDLEP